jgi:hypothetical protein
MVSRCRGSVDLNKLNNSFKNANSSIELLQKIGDQNKLIGIMMCLKYFKSVINKYFKSSTKKKKLESLIDLNKLNDKLESLSKKMEVLEKTLSTNLYCKNASLKSFSLNNYSTNNYNSSFTNSVYAIHSPSKAQTQIDL